MKGELHFCFVVSRDCTVNKHSSGPYRRPAMLTLVFVLYPSASVLDAAAQEARVAVSERREGGVFLTCGRFVCASIVCIWLACAKKLVI